MDLMIPLATLATVGRIFGLIGLSIVSGWLLAYGSAIGGDVLRSEQLG